MAELIYDPGEPEPKERWFEEGVAPGWLVVNNGDGTGQAKRVFALTDGEGDTVFEDAGEWEDVPIR